MVHIVLRSREHFTFQHTEQPIKIEYKSPDPARLPPWVTSPSVLKAWFENANKLRHAETTEMWRNGVDFGHNFSYLEKSFLRKMEHPFEKFMECSVTVDKVDREYRVTMELRLSAEDTHVLLMAEGIDHINPMGQTFDGLVSRPVWSSAARYELHDRGPVLAPFLCLCKDDVRPYSVLLHAPTVMWQQVRTFVRLRAIALYWQERTQRQLCAPNGTGRILDQLAYAQWNLMTGM